MSSSSDEDQSYRNVQLPNLRLDTKAKRSNNPLNLNASRSNLAKAGKKLTGNKSVRFPDSYTPRDTIISNNSATTNSDSELEELTSAGPLETALPSFQFRASDVAPEDDDSESSDEEPDSDLENRIPNFRTFQNRPENLMESDDDESEEEDNSSKSSKKSNRNPIAYDVETDLTEQPKRPSITSSNSRNSGERSGGGIKGILRKMSLAEHAYTGGFAPPETSASDGFLGRIMSIGGNQSISGGGLAPGASRRGEDIRELDEEEKVGEPSGSIEMQPLGYEELNQEAQNLISVHLPGHVRDQLMQGSSSRDPDAEDHEDEHTEYDSEPDASKEGFYAPNPDMFLRREANNDFDPDDFNLDDDMQDGYIAPPKQVHAGVLSSLLRLYENPQESRSASSFGSRTTDNATLADESTFMDSVDTHSRHSTVDFAKWKSGIKSAPKNMAHKFTHKKSKNVSSVPESPDDDEGGSFDEKRDHDGAKLPSFQNAKPKAPKKGNMSNINLQKKVKMKKLKNHKKANRLRITVHIADILQRQRFIMRMCRALMLFGAPTHRLEEYMIMTSRVLEIDGQFIYLPGCMIIAFGDAATRTSEVHLVRCAQGVNLSKLSDTHKIYKGVIHDLMGVEDAALKLEDLLRKKNLYPPWLCVFLYGLGSAMVCPFAFGGGWIDLPIAFGVGCCVGYLQFIISSISNLYSSVFEVTASIVVAFIARAIGSVRGGNLFCFSAIAQGSLALILPGYIILSGSLELQSRNLVAGSVRMFYAIIYSMFLGFGITLGGALYGWVDKNSTSASTCAPSHSMDDKWRILFVPMFTLSLGLINQARWSQLPAMIFISAVGYLGNYFAGKHFSSVTEFTACIGAFIVGILGNLYSRIWKGMAVSAMLPAIFVQVPSGIASQSSLVAGISAADQITHSNSSSSDSSSSSSSGSLSFGQTMVEVAIGISVGLFAAALVVYPLGKKRTGLFTL